MARAQYGYPRLRGFAEARPQRVKLALEPDRILFVALVLGLLAACGPAGEPVPGFQGAYWHGDSTGAAVACALSFAPQAIAQDTYLSEAEVFERMVPLEVEVTSSICVSDWTDAEGRCAQGDETDDTDLIRVNFSLHEIAHEIRHKVMRRLTRDGQGAHVDPVTGPWSLNFELVYRANLRAVCGL